MNNVEIVKFLEGEKEMENNNDLKIELLTKEEKEFLKCWKFDKLYITFNEWLMIYSKTIGSGIILEEELKLKFKGLRREKKYTSRELGL